MLRFWPIAAALLLASCGGGGGGDGGGIVSPPAPPQSSWIRGSFMPAASFAGQCAVPRAGTHPLTGEAWPDVQGSVLAENNWLRSWSNELYLWYDEIVDRDPSLYGTPRYFELLKTDAATPSGTPKDRFHFTVPTDEWIQLAVSAISAGYGAEWIVLANVPPRHVVIAYTEPGSPAADADLRRGDRVITADGVDVQNANDAGSVATLNAAFFPRQAGATHTFTVMRASGGTRTVTMQSAEVQSTPVQNVTVLPQPSGEAVGYFLFNDHLAPAEAQLIAAIEDLKAAAVTDLVIDLRYNGGGLLALASELAYMIAGPARTAGRVFERLRFNDKHTATDPVTGQPLAPLPFQQYALISAPGAPLPTLDLPRVFVLTGSNTCSASESIINSLRGIDLEVIQIGGSTCGKPYGFYPADNCGTTYFSIQFKGENEKGFGDYADGFRPRPGPQTEPDVLPGCLVGDDFTRELGDPAEARLAAALQYRDSATCPPATVTPLTLSKPAAHADVRDGVLTKNPWRENRILTPVR